MMNCAGCNRLVSLRDAMCPGCGRFLITDRPLAAQGSPSAAPMIAIAVLLDVLALFVWLGYGSAADYERHARREQARNDTMAIHPVAEKWRADHEGACPTVTGLRDDRELAATSKLTDPWDDLYRIECHADETWVSSDGPDRRRGTADDIVTHEPEPPYQD